MGSQGIHEKKLLRPQVFLFCLEGGKLFKVATVGVAPDFVHRYCGSPLPSPRNIQHA